MIDFTHLRMAGRPKSGSIQAQQTTRDYDPELFAFITAVDQAKTTARMPFPPTSMVYEVVQRLGYRRLSDTTLSKCSVCENPNCRRLYIKRKKSSRFCSRTCINEWRKVAGNKLRGADWPNEAMSILQQAYPERGWRAAREALVRAGFKFSEEAIFQKARRMGLKRERGRTCPRSSSECSSTNATLVAC